MNYMDFATKEIVENLRKEYPEGTRVVLIKMDDFQAPPIGTKGTVRGVDDTGSILVKWDNGSGLNVVYGEDKCEKIEEIKVICYDEEEIWYDRKKAISFYFEAMQNSEGSEQARYTKIYTDLLSGKIICTDED